MSLKEKAIVIAKAVRDLLGEDFLPGNINRGGDRVGNQQRQAALLQLRTDAGGGLSGLDKPKMFAMMVKTAVLVKERKQGACGELAARCRRDGSTSTSTRTSSTLCTTTR